MKVAKKVKCSKCGYGWTTESDLKFISCPSCLQKTLNKKEGDTNGKDSKGN